MKDISKCTNSSCPLKNNCYRFTSVPSKHLQSYTDWQFTIIKGNHIACDGFWSKNTQQIFNQLKDIVKGIAH